MDETNPLLKPKVDANNAEWNLEHAANDAYEALVDDNIDDEELDEDALWLREQRNSNRLIHWLKRPSIILIGIIIFTFSFAIFVGESNRKIITFKLACNLLMMNSSKPYCDPNEVEVVVSNLQLFYTIGTSIMSMIAMTQIGKLSDLYGRKLFISIIIANILIARTFKLILMTRFDYLKFGLMVFSEIIGSFTGGMMNFIALLNCYVSDISEPHEKSYFLGIGLAFFFSGISLGPLIGNFINSLAKDFNKSKTSTITDTSTFNNIDKSEFITIKFELIVFACLLLFAIFFLPESRPEKSRLKSRRQSSINIQQQSSSVFSYFNIFQPLKILIIPQDFKPPKYSNAKFFRERLAVFILIMSDCFFSSIGATLLEIFVLFGFLKLGWDSNSIGYLLTVGCACRAFVLIILAPLVNYKLLQRVFKLKLMKKQYDMIDFTITFGGLLIEGLCLFGFAFVKNNTQFFTLLTFSCLGSLVSPTLSSSIVKYYPDSQTGELFSAISLVKNILNIVFPIAVLSIYKEVLKLNHPGFVFLFLGSFVGICAGGILTAKALLGLNSNSEPEVLSRTSSFARSKASSSRSNSIISRSNSFSEGSSGLMNDQISPLARGDSFNSTYDKRRPSFYRNGSDSDPLLKFNDKMRSKDSKSDTKTK